MQEYINNLRARFGSGKRLADYLGVSGDTVASWACGRSKPSGEVLRLLEVLGTVAVDAPELFAMMIGKQAPRTQAALPALPVVVVEKDRIPTPKEIWDDYHHKVAAYAAIQAAKEPLVPVRLYGNTPAFWRAQVDKQSPETIEGNGQLREIVAWLAVVDQDTL